MMQSIKNLITQLYQNTGLRIIKANTTAPVPPLPYGVYNVTSPYIKDAGMENEAYIDNGDSLTAKREEQYKVTISFNIYAKDDETTIDLAMQVRQWFLFYGRDFIQSQNNAVVSVGNIENRTTFLVDSYEYKHGFDVQLRLSDEQTMENIDYFDKIGE